MRLLCHITIEAQSGETYSFRYANSIRIEKSRYKLTDMATVEIPKNLRINRGAKIVGPSAVFRRGDKITIRLGYAPELVTRFVGYISKLEPRETMVLHCEDESFLLKENIIEKASYSQVSLETLLDDICPIPFNAANTNLGDLRLTNVSTAQVLDSFRSKYGIQSWIEDGVLQCGLTFEDRDPDPVTFRFEWNVIQDNLIWQDADDIKMAAKCISIQGDNQKREVTVGSSSPTHRITLFFPDNMSEADLIRQGEEKLKGYQFTGFEGTFEAFGAPLINHSGIVKLEDPKAQERTGSYWVKKVSISWGMSGYRQTVELDRKAIT